MDVRELFDLSGEVALVTGASSGLGEHFAETLAAAGARVVAVARRKERLDELVGRISAGGAEAQAAVADVTDRTAVARAFDAAEARWGTVSLLVNNAGIAGQKRALDMEEADWRRVLDTNLDAVWFTAQEAARRMVKAGRPGTIINIASVLGFRVAPTLVAYSVAKAGVVQLTAALALELARHRIRVNAIAPGYVLTEINQEFFASPEGKEFIKSIPQRRIATPGDLDGTLLLLASTRASGFMTGSTVVIDGGHMLVSS
jgi:NAD(P)-dependent dehydrogenase (short-subunit alcohol dehydrogenase family)